MGGEVPRRMRPVHPAEPYGVRSWRGRNGRCRSVARRGMARWVAIGIVSLPLEITEAERQHRQIESVRPQRRTAPSLVTIGGRGPGSSSSPLPTSRGGEHDGGRHARPCAARRRRRMGDHGGGTGRGRRRRDALKYDARRNATEPVDEGVGTSRRSSSAAVLARLPRATRLHARLTGAAPDVGEGGGVDVAGIHRSLHVGDALRSARRDRPVPWRVHDRPWCFSPPVSTNAPTGAPFFMSWPVPLLLWQSVALPISPASSSRPASRLRD